MDNEINPTPRTLKGTFQRADLHPDPLFADEGCSSTIVNRFWRHVVKTKYCWNWVGVQDGCWGTGVIGRGGRDSGNIKARRVSWIIHFAAPANRRILLTCKNPVCVNPEHFKIGYGEPMPELLPPNRIIQPCPDDELDYASQDPTLPEGFSKTFLIRFLRKVDKTSSPHGCWLWTGGKNQDGYGTIGRGRGQIRNVIGTHKAAWLIYKGPIPDGLKVLHNCPGGDNRACCNPDHLWLGTEKQNTVDAVQKSELRGKIHWNSILSPEDRDNIIKELSNGSVVKAELARRYNISPSAIQRILRQMPTPEFFRFTVSGAAKQSAHTGNHDCQSVRLTWPATS